MQARALVAVLVAVVIMLTFQFYISKRYPVLNKVVPKHETGSPSDSSHDSQPAVVSNPGTDRALGFYQRQPESDNVGSEIDTGVTALRISGNHPFVLFNKSKKFNFKDDGLFISSGIGGIGSIIDHEGMTVIENGTRMIKHTDLSVTYESQISDYVYVEKVFEFQKGSYIANLSVVFKNQSGQNERLVFRIVGASSLTSSEETDGQFSSVAVKKKGSMETIRRRWSDLSKKPILDIPSGFEWAGVHNRYFSTLFKPSWSDAKLFVESAGENQSPIIGVIDTIEIPPGGEIRREIQLYMGPMELSELERGGFHDVLDFGMFGMISRVILSAMFWMKSWTKSYGFSIILMTGLLNVLLYPMTFKSLMSMRKIQSVQPLVDALREKYKDDYQKMNKELMELYRKNRINPIGGCIPMVFQMPIFIALYQALSKSVELWGTSFLAISDLSRPDHLVNLPFVAPLIGSSINVLPVVMCAVMFIQQKTMSTVSSDQTKQMMLIFPLMFLFICYKMPSGLIIYWITHTLITASMQLFVTKRMGLS